MGVKEEDDLQMEDLRLPTPLTNRLKNSLEKLSQHNSAVDGFAGFGSFHSENVEVLIAQDDRTYQPPEVPLVAKRVLSLTEIVEVYGSANNSPLISDNLSISDKPQLYQLSDSSRFAATCTPSNPLQGQTPEERLKILVKTPLLPYPFGPIFKREHFLISEDVVFINHGGFGSALRGALEMKQQLERRMENEVVEFVDRELLPLAVYSVRELARFLGAEPKDLVLVQNATYALNSAVKLIVEGDVVAYFDTEYLAVYKILWYRCKQVDASLHELALNKYLHDESVMGNDEELASYICASLPPGCTTLVMSHITSTTALCFPVFSHIIPAVRRMGVNKIIVDGAHAPLQVNLRFGDLSEDAKPSAYVGNLHKWFSSPKAAGFLWLLPRQDGTHVQSAVLSHGAGDGFLSEYIWDGTKDYGAYFCVPSIIQFWEAQGLDRVRHFCESLLEKAGKMLVEAFGSRPVARHSPFMTLIELPKALQGSSITAKSVQDRLHDYFGIEVPVKQVENRLYLRISAFVYNTLPEYVYLKEAVMAVSGSYDSTH